MVFKKFKEKATGMLKGDERRLGTQQQGQSSQQSNFHPSNPWYTPAQSQEPGSSEKDRYQPPQGLPTNHVASSSGYAPPPGPPPSHIASYSDYAPPPGPPPSQQLSSSNPPPYHDWQAIPDTALLPPPPSIGYETSPTANASEEDGERAFLWTQHNPLWPPQNLAPEAIQMIQNWQFSLLKAPTYIGDISPQRHPGHWICRTSNSCRDSCLLTNLPIYSALLDSPLRTHQSETIYFELKVLAFRGGASLEEAEAGVAIGFVAPPYPTFRCPGWQRGSLGVHGDDGRKYVNDTFGGVDFTTAFSPNDVVGIGMTFAAPKDPPSYEQSQQGKILDIDVFFTRNGIKEGSWDGNAELDERSEGGTNGIRGECDLFPAIGCFGGVDFEVFFSPEQWMYNPY